MDCGGVSKIQQFKITFLILSHSSVPEINSQHTIAIVSCDGRNVSDIAITDVFTVFCLHDFVPHAVDPISIQNLRLFPVLRVDDALEPVIQRIDTCLRFLPVWG